MSNYGCGATCHGSGDVVNERRKSPDEQVDIDQITKSLKSSHLDDPVAESGVQHHAAGKQLGRVLEDGECDDQAPDTSSGCGERIQSDPGSPLGSQCVSASPPFGQPPMSPEIPAPVPSVFKPSSVWNASPHAGLLAQFQQPKFPFLLKPATPLEAENQRPNALIPQPTSLFPPDLPPIARAPPKTYNEMCEPKLSSGLQLLPEADFSKTSKRGSAGAEADTLEITETVASSSLRSLNGDKKRYSGESPRARTGHKKLGDRSDHERGEEARLHTEAAKHAPSTDASESSNCTSSEIDATDTEVINHPEDESRIGGPFKDSPNGSDPEPEDRSDGNDDYGPDIESDNNRREIWYESRYQSNNEKRGRGSDFED
jgi:hypothetical protein